MDDSNQVIRKAEDSQEIRDRVVSELLRNEGWKFLVEQCKEHIDILKKRIELRLNDPVNFNEREIFYYWGLTKGIEYVLSIPEVAKEALKMKNFGGSGIAT